MTRLLPALAIVLIASLSAAGQATEVVASRDDFLVGITQEWGRNSTLGDLVAASFGIDDVELRFWSGYGLAGTHGLILRRTAGRWNGWRAQVEECIELVPSPAVDTLSPRAIADYERLARHRCKHNPQFAGEVRIIESDTVALYRIQRVDLEALWASLIRAGLDSIPSDVPQEAIIDGHSYVVELRRGKSYRAFSTVSNPVIRSLAKLVEPLRWGP